MKILIYKGQSIVNNINMSDYGKSIIGFGRSPDCDIVLNSKYVSGTHGCFSIEDGLCTIHDMDSTNGIKVNGYPIKEKVLQDGDIIEIYAGGSDDVIKMEFMASEEDMSISADKKHKKLSIAVKILIPVVIIAVVVLLCIIFLGKDDKSGSKNEADVVEEEYDSKTDEEASDGDAISENQVEEIENEDTETSEEIESTESTEEITTVEEPVIIEVDVNSVSQSMKDFLSAFNMHTYVPDFDSSDPMASEFNILRMVLNEPFGCVDYTLYPRYEGVDDGIDYGPYVHNYYDRAGIDWIVTNIFNVDSSYLEPLFKNRESEYFIRTQDSYIYLTEGYGGDVSLKEYYFTIDYVTTDGTKYYVDYTCYWERYEDMGDDDEIRGYAVVEEKVIDGVSYWTMYSNKLVEVIQ